MHKFFASVSSIYADGVQPLDILIGIVHSEDIFRSLTLINTTAVTKTREQTYHMHA